MNTGGSVPARLADRPTRRLYPRPAALVRLAVLLALVAAPGALRAESRSLARDRWTVMAGWGRVSPYTYYRQPYGWYVDSEGFSFGRTAQLAVKRRLSDWLALRVEGSWVGYDRSVALVSIPEIPPAKERLAVNAFPLDFGFRLAPALRESPGIRPYLDLAPSLYLMRWERKEWNPGYESTGMVEPATVTDEIRWTRLRPGFAFGVGFEFRATSHLRLEAGFHHRDMASPGTMSLVWPGGPARGLNENGVAVQIGWGWRQPGD